MEDPLLMDNTRVSVTLCPHTPVKRARSDSFDAGTDGKNKPSRRVKEEDRHDLSSIFLPMSPHTYGDYENLGLLLIEERRMNEGLIQQNQSLFEALRRTRRELGNLRAKINFVGQKLQEEAGARMSHGSNLGSDDESEQVKSELDSG
ncbi:hypothetical protein B0H12DRAFT_1080955 [Mycena haematopus]|nr:hypothetical protein B0H12DRAFT_1080955 [Mycena haematopus]